MTHMSRRPGLSVPLTSPVISDTRRHVQRGTGRRGPGARFGSSESSHGSLPRRVSSLSASGRREPRGRPARATGPAGRSGRCLRRGAPLAELGAAPPAALHEPSQRRARRLSPCTTAREKVGSPRRRRPAERRARAGRRLMRKHDPRPAACRKGPPPGGPPAGRATAMDQSAGRRRRPAKTGEPVSSK